MTTSNSNIAIRVVDVQHRTFDSLYEKFILNGKHVLDHEGRVFLTNALQTHDRYWQHVRDGKSIPGGIISDDPLLDTKVLRTNYRNKITFNWRTIIIHLEYVDTWCTLRMPGGRLAHATDVLRFTVPRLAFVVPPDDRHADSVVHSFIEYLQQKHTFQTIRLMMNDLEIQQAKTDGGGGDNNNDDVAIPLAAALPCYLHVASSWVNLNHEFVIRVDSPMTMHIQSDTIKKHVYMPDMATVWSKVRPLIDATIHNTRDTRIYPKNIIYFDALSSFFILPDAYLHEEYAPGRINHRVFLSIGDPVHEIVNFIVYPPLLFSGTRVEEKNNTNAQRFLGFSTTSSAMLFLQKYSSLPSCLCIYEAPFVLLVYGGVWLLTLDFETIGNISNAAFHRLLVSYRAAAVANNSKKKDGGRNVPQYFVFICQKFIRAII